MTAKTPTPVSDEDIAKILDKAPDGDADIPAEEAKEPTTIVEQAYEIAYLAKDIAKQVGIPLGTAVTVVKTTLEYNLNRDALKFEIARSAGPFVPPGAKPVALPDTDNEEEQ